MFLAGLVVDWINLDTTVKVQSAKTLTGLRLWMTVPAIILLVIGIFVYKSRYKPVSYTHLVMFVPKIFKISPYVVVSESMEPTYSKGDLIYVKNDTSDIKNGDVITFYTDKNTIVTHRVTGINVSDHTYTTKGDANQTDDPRPVSMRCV